MLYRGVQGFWLISLTQFSLSATTHAHPWLCSNFIFHWRQKSAPCWRTVELHTTCKQRSCELFPNPYKHNTVFSWIYKLLYNHKNNQCNCLLPYDRVTGICNSAPGSESLCRGPIVHFPWNVSGPKWSTGYCHEVGLALDIRRCCLRNCDCLTCDLVFRSIRRTRLQGVGSLYVLTIASASSLERA